MRMGSLALRWIEAVIVFGNIRPELTMHDSWAVKPARGAVARAYQSSVAGKTKQLLAGRQL